MRKAVWLCAILISAVMLLCLSACEKESGADVSGPANGETAAENAAEPDDGAPDPAEAGEAGLARLSVPAGSGRRWHPGPLPGRPAPGGC